MNDRSIAGGIAGIIGAIAQNLYGLIAKTTGITDRSFSDFAQVLIMFESYEGFLAAVVGKISHLTVGLLFGIVFAYLTMYSTSKYVLIKGIGYGAILWMLLMGFGTVFELPMFKDIPPNAALSTFFGALIYGLVLAYMLGFIEKKTKL